MASKPGHSTQTELDSIPQTSRLYDALPTDEPHIRLLELSPGESDSQIEGKLSVHKLSEAPAYSAISYVWGNPHPTVTIKINGLPAEIGHNCHYALWQVRSLSLARFYWIDTLCINQIDLDEKSIQVWSMGQIFEIAQRVFACVGPHSEDSLAFLDIVRAWPTTIDAEIDLWLSPVVHLQEFEKQLRQHSEINELLFSRNSKINLRAFITAATNFYLRPYWSRLWIVQEITMAEDVLLICGLDTIDWKRFSTVILSNYIPDKFFHSCLDRSGERQEHELRRSNGMNNVKNIIRTQLLSCVDFSNRRLMGLMQKFRSMQCLNPLDRVYGLLHLMDKRYPLEKRLVPDYKQSPLSLALQCLNLLDLDRVETGQYTDSEFLSSVGALLQALELDRQQSEARTLIQARQRAFSDLCTRKSIPVDIQLNKDAHDALLVTDGSEHLAEDYIVLYASSYSSAVIEQSTTGELIIDDHISDLKGDPLEALCSTALFYAEHQGAPSEAPLILKPKEPQSSACATAVICSRAKAGDYCIRFAKFFERTLAEYDHEPCLVIRRCGSSRLFEIIGQGFLAGPPRFFLYPKLDLTLYFRKEDLLFLAMLELREAVVKESRTDTDSAKTDWPDNDEDSLHALRVDRLFTAPTIRAFSSFAIEEEVSIDTHPL